MPFYIEDYNRCVNTEIKFAVLPRKCYITGKLLWLTTAYKLTYLWTGPGDHIVEHRWCSKNEFLLARLKNNL